MIAAELYKRRACDLLIVPTAIKPKRYNTLYFQVINTDLSDTVRS